MTGAIAEMVPERRDDCACPFDAPGEAPPTTDPKSACFEGSLRAFLTRKYGQGDINQAVCQDILDSGGGGSAFYPLYFLDHKWCGLQWNDPTALNQDPGVDMIINLCHGLGFPHFVDPGVPPESYQCSICSSSTPKQADPLQSPGVTALSASLTSTSVAPTTASEQLTTSTSVISSISPSSSKFETSGAALTSTATPYTDIFLPTSTATTSAATPSRTLPTEAIVAIVVCTTLALVSAVILLICVLRRRQKQMGEHDGDIRTRISRIVQGFAAPADSPQRLISPSQSYCADRPPLTPPLPLRDRKLLPSLLEPNSRPTSIDFGLPFERHHSNNSQSSCYSSHRPDDKDSFPSSPICSPTYNRLEPRQEKAHQKAPSLVTSAASLTSEPSSPPYTRLKSPPPVSFTFPPSSQDNTIHSISQYPKGRASSLRKEITSTTSSTSSNYITHERHPNSTGTISLVDAADNPSVSTSPSAPTPPSSPIRPRRPHEGPLEIPDLVSPLSIPRSPSPGPPPSKALPPPPLSLRPPPASMGIGIATTTTTTTGARAGSASPQSRPEYGLHGHRPGRHHRHHLYDQGTAAADGERTASRDSWGSWEDLTPASLIGRAMSPPAGRTVYPYPDS